MYARNTEQHFRSESSSVMPLLNYTTIRHIIAYLSLHILSGSSVVQQLKVKQEVNKIC
jgi:hypothetical protein